MKGLGLLASALAVGAVTVIHNFMKSRNEKQKYEKLIPHFLVEKHGDICVERFGDYVVRQVGLDPETAAARRLVRVAEDYLRGDKTRTDDSLENLFVFLTRVCPEVTDDEIKDLNNQFVRELDTCMVTYFSFHWEHTAGIIEQVVNGGSMKKLSLKRAVLTATRKQRFQRVMKDLKTQRWFANMLELMRAIGKHSPSTPDHGAVVVPAHASVRSPVLLMLGGGMGAGKSTVVKEILEGPFWKSVAGDAVVVEADAFKERDVIYRALSSMDHGENISEAAELVHESSTNSASALLVTALNEGRDVILDGTMSWEPFVLQTIAMARDVHKKQYRMGPGYVKNPDGSVLEKYWETVEDCEGNMSKHESTESQKALENGEITSPASPASPASGSILNQTQHLPERKPYRIEFVGIICDAHMAVVRGMRRAIITKRGVPVRGQLRSHKLFSLSLERYSELMDMVKIFSTSAMGGPAELIALKDGAHKLLKNCEEFLLLKDLNNLNPDATSIHELYDKTESTLSHKKWENFVLAPERNARQQRLMIALNQAQLDRELSDLDLSSRGNSPSISPMNSAASSMHSNDSRSTNGSSRQSDDLSPGVNG